jgi:hypothetical protein
VSRRAMCVFPDPGMPRTQISVLGLVPIPFPHSTDAFFFIFFLRSPFLRFSVSPFSPFSLFSFFMAQAPSRLPV